MNSKWPTVSLRKALTPISRSESVDPERTYHILGAHWYAEGLYTKEIAKGSLIRASKVYRIEQGDFVYNRLFAWKGSFAVATEENHGCYVSNEFPAFAINSDLLDPQYLWRYFSRASTWEEALGLSTGGTPTSRNRLKEEKLLAMEIPLPPIEEQRRIVARIEELAARIEEARELRRRAVEEARAFWRQTMASSFTPTDDISTTIEDVCEDIIDNLHSTPKYNGNDYPCIRSQDVGWGTINYSTALRTDKEEFLERTRRGEPCVGDILYVREGDVGRCAVVDGSQRFSLGQRVMMLRPDNEKIDSRFLMIQLMSEPVLHNQVLSAMTGTTSHHVNIKHIRRVRINLPPLREQHLIVAHFDGLNSKLDALRRHQSETSAALEALLPAVLERAFRGVL